MMFYEIFSIQHMKYWKELKVSFDALLKDKNFIKADIYMTLGKNRIFRLICERQAKRTEITSANLQN